MREQRMENAAIYIKFPRNPGKKTVKIALFHASQFKSGGIVNTSGRTYPPAPIRRDKDADYWNREHYRIMIGEKWFSPKAKYTFYTLDEIMEIAKEALA